MDIQQKYDLLKQILHKYKKVIIAYSGGVDSTFLLKVAIDTLGVKNVLACIASGPALADEQLKSAMKIAEDMGVDPRAIVQTEITDSAYAANKADRCFHCKSHLFNDLNRIAELEKFECVMSGNNFDDRQDYRPGNKAAKQLGVIAPLMQAELTKNDIRQLSRELNLPTADMPASPCLASRISYGLEVTGKRLSQIEQAENLLRSLGLVEFRVRHHDTVARIEAKPEDMVKIMQKREQIVEKLKAIGFKFVSLDLQGFRSGALNESLSEEEKQKNI
jgi:pyridinium-3,5-biscarboxylic acid mononucleotide sulfurtransferase